MTMQLKRSRGWRTGVLPGVFAIAICSPVSAQDSAPRGADVVPRPHQEHGNAGPRTVVVIITVEHFDDPAFGHAAQFMDDDGLAIHRTFAALLGADAEIHRFSTNADESSSPATQANLVSNESALARVLDAVRPLDTVIVCISSHGFAIGNEGYIALKDSRMTDLPATSLSISDLHRRLTDCRAGNKLLSVDACHSGAITQRFNVAIMLALFAQTPNILTIASCRAEQSSWECPEREAGIYTHYFIDALLGAADADQDHVVNTQELYAHVYSRVPEDVYQLYRREQMPRAFVLGEIPVFPLTAYNPRQYVEDFARVDPGLVPDGWEGPAESALRVRLVNGRRCLAMSDTGTASVLVRPPREDEGPPWFIANDFYVEARFRLYGIGGRRKRHLTIDLLDRFDQSIATVVFKDEYRWTLNAGGDDVEVRRTGGANPADGSDQSAVVLRIERDGDKLRIKVNGTVYHVVSDVSGDSLAALRLTIYNQQNWDASTGVPSVFHVAAGPLN